MCYSQGDAMSARLRNVPKYRGIPSRNNGDVVVYTGLSVHTTCGHTIRLMRDVATKTAEVRVSVIDGGVTSLPENASLVSAIEAFEGRAQRFLGMNWSIMPWDGKVHGRSETKDIPADKIAGYKSKSQHL